MKRPKKQPLTFSRPRNISHKCQSCGIVSKDVNKSIIYKKYFCIQCLADNILSNTQERD